jgi:predicted nicotinamide N-methyase
MRPPLAAILADMPLRPVPFTPGIRLHLAHPGSGLRRLADSDEPPYWAYVWGGGAALARYMLGHPQTVAGRRVLDLGAGGGIVGIAAALAGARQVLASDTDPNALAVLGVNAAANGVAIEIQPGDLTAGPPPDVDLVAVGDLFYAADLAERVTGFLDRCLAVGIEVLVGDPYRAYLPSNRLRVLADCPTPDFGDGPSAATAAAVFAFTPSPEQ